MKKKANKRAEFKSKAAKLSEERRKDQMQIDFLKWSSGCDMTLAVMYRKTEQWIFYMDM